VALYLYFGARDVFVPKRSRSGICWQFLFYVVLQLMLKMRFMHRTGDPASVRSGSLNGDAYELKLSRNENKSMQVLIVRATIYHSEQDSIFSV